MIQKVATFLTPVFLTVSVYFIRVSLIYHISPLSYLDLQHPSSRYSKLQTMHSPSRLPMSGINPGIIVLGMLRARKIHAAEENHVPQTLPKP
jgi:hypothetical protein